MTPGTGSWVVGVDSGGSGLRVALAEVVAGGPGPAETVVSRTPVRTGEAGIDARHLLEQLLPMVRGLQDRGAGDGRPVTAVAVGAAGMATLGGQLRAVLPGALEEALGIRGLALATDAVTAYAGALGQRPGAVVAAGTGMVAVGTDLTEWRRADGWGHLLGDCGGGAWLGRAGLTAALRAHDGRRGGSTALLAAAQTVFGPPAGLPGKLYPRTDRPAVLASFAPEVARCAAEGDPVATGIVAEAARRIADAAEAVCPRETDGPPDIALTGGLLRIGDPLLVPLLAELTDRLPQARVVPPAGDPLSGALSIAASLATGSLRLPGDPAMLHLVTPGTPRHD
ncbi:ATPase [Streptomyces qinzhouensis]|uniref:ATPase n=1 Tax=Streptomyces qinzhouensis TaxID=2599401 RepID=A0A5B8JRR6_9ACTN|nr:ATPase [Streptomyces qinzhouensis]